MSDRTGALGLFREGTHEVIDLPGCVVLDPRVARAVRVLRELLRVSPIVEGVDVVAVEGGCLVTLLASKEIERAQLTTLAARLVQREPSVLGVALRRREERSPQLLSGSLEVLSGPDAAPRRIASDLPVHLVSHGGFVQAHDGTAAAIQRAIATRLDALVHAPRVLELYAGAGGLSLWLSARGAKVTAVDSFAPAVERLGRVAREQGLAIDVRAEDAARAVTRLVESRQRFDAVIVNPPRRGLDPAVREALAALAPKLVAYVSCEPSTLARDLAHLALLGQGLGELFAFDMMPLTDQVEALAFVEAAAVPTPEVVHEAEGFIAVVKPPHEPIAGRVRSLTARVRELPGLEDARCVTPLRPGASGLALFARDAASEASLREALSEGARSYQVLAKGITHKRGRIERTVREGKKKARAQTRFVRQEVISGHSLLRVWSDTGHDLEIVQHLASLGHPVIGMPAPGDRRTNVHFAMRHGLDRPFLHAHAVSLGPAEEGLSLETGLAADLRFVLDSLRASGQAAGRSVRETAPTIQRFT